MTKIRDHTVAGAVTESDLQLVRLAADEEEKSVSTFVRDVTVEAARQTVAGNARENRDGEDS